MNTMKRIYYKIRNYFAKPKLTKKQQQFYDYVDRMERWVSQPKIVTNFRPYYSNTESCRVMTSKMLKKLYEMGLIEKRTVENSKGSLPMNIWRSL